MHEMSLARELVRLVDEQCEAHGYRQVLCIHLQLDAYSCAAPEAISFAFESARYGRLAEARLEIERVESVGCCSICSYRAVLNEAYAACPRCGGMMMPLQAGGQRSASLRSDSLQTSAMQAGDIRVTGLEVI